MSKTYHFEDLAVGSDYPELAAKIAKYMMEIIPTELGVEGPDNPTPVDVIKKRTTALLYTAVSAAHFFGQPLDVVMHNVKAIYDHLSEIRKTGEKH